MMKIQGWKRTKRFFTSVALATLFSGCHGIHSGVPHPFTTMFSYQDERQPPQLTLKDLRIPRAEEMPEAVTAAKHSRTVY